MNIVIGAVVLFWSLLGAVFFGFVLYNFFQKAYKPYFAVPILLSLLIFFGISVISLLYHVNQLNQSYLQSPSHGNNNYKSNGIPGLYQ